MNHWPCPCATWCRTEPKPATRHHPNCKYVDESLIDVWRVELDGNSYVTDSKATATQERKHYKGVKITKQKMHREIYENLQESPGL